MSANVLCAYRMYGFVIDPATFSLHCEDPSLRMNEGVLGAVLEEVVRRGAALKSRHSASASMSKAATPR